MQYEPPYGAPGANDSYVNGDPSIARPGSIIPAQAVENPQRELVNLIASEGLTPTDADLMQVTKGVRSQWVNFCVDTGAQNALSVALNPPLDAYRQGIPLRVLVANDNSAGCTINVNGLGGRQIIRTTGLGLQPGDLRSGMIAELVDDGTRFQLVNYLGASPAPPSATRIEIPYAEDASSTANSLVCTFNPAISAIVNGVVVEVRVANANTGNTTMSITNLPTSDPYYGAQPVYRTDGQPLQAGDIGATETVLLEWNHTYWQMLKLVRSQVYFKIAQSLTLYVNSIYGLDTNDGHDANHAFRTIQGGINYIQNSYLIAGRTVILQLAPGTYHGQVVITNLPGTIGIQGDPNNMLSYIIQGPTSAEVHGEEAVTVGLSGSGTNAWLYGVCLVPSDGAANVIECNYGASLNLNDVSFGPGPTTTGNLCALFGGQLTCGNWIHIYMQCGAVLGASPGTITCGDWPCTFQFHGYNFQGGNGAFIGLVDSYAAFSYGYTSFPGGNGAAGYQYFLYYNSVLNLGNAPLSWFPGTMAGGADASSVVAHG